MDSYARKYLDYIIIGLKTEQKFGDVLKQGKRDIAQHIDEEDFSSDADYLYVYDKYYDLRHPVRNNLFYMDCCSADVRAYIHKLTEKTHKPLVIGKVEKVTESTEDTQAFKKWFGDSHVVDDSNDPLIVYHGTVKNFTKFDKSLQAVDAYVGKGFYFTDSSDDAVDNYHVAGADLKAKMECLGDDIVCCFEHETPDDLYSKLEDKGINIDKEPFLAFLDDFATWDKEDMTSTEIGDKVIEWLYDNYKESEGSTMPVYLSMQKPFYYGKDIEEYWDAEIVYNTADRIDDARDELGADATEEEVEERAQEMAEDDGDYEFEGKGYAFLEAAQGVLEYNYNVKASNVFDMLYVEDGITTTELRDKYINATDNIMDSPYDAHNSFRDIIEEMGYDGIIMSIPEQWHGWMSPDVKHYIVFEPTQIKSVFNKGTYSINSADILEKENYEE